MVNSKTQAKNNSFFKKSAGRCTALLYILLECPIRSSKGYQLSQKKTRLENFKFQFFRIIYSIIRWCIPEWPANSISPQKNQSGNNINFKKIDIYIIRWYYGTMRPILPLG